MSLLVLRAESTLLGGSSFLALRQKADCCLSPFQLAGQVNTDANATGFGLPSAGCPLPLPPLPPRQSSHADTDQTTRLVLPSVRSLVKQKQHRL